MNRVHDILNIRRHAIVTQGADGEPVTAVTITVAEVDVVRWAAERQAIISVENDVVLQ